jgi:hypothetical protein
MTLAFKAIFSTRIGVAFSSIPHSNSSLPRFATCGADLCSGVLQSNPGFVKSDDGVMSARHRRASRGAQIALRARRLGCASVPTPFVP